MDSCAERLKIAAGQKGLKQVDLVKLTGIPKSAMSQYFSGRITPKNDRLYLIGEALDVSPVWLMGKDVPMRETSHNNNAVSTETAKEKLALLLFRNLNDAEQDYVISSLKGLQANR